MATQQYIVGFNGPPRVGKDSVAQAFATLLDNEALIPCHTDHLARPMRDEVLGQLDINRNDLATYNRVKDDPQPLFNGASIREHMIAYSEKFIKPRYGQDFWGRRLIHDHEWIELGIPGVLLIPDIGFRDEILALEKTSASVAIVQLSRIDDVATKANAHRLDGGSVLMGWGNDSRRYCNGDISSKIELRNESISRTAEKLFDILTITMGWSFR